MTIDAAKEMTGAWVRTTIKDGKGGHMIGAKLLGVKGHNIMVKIPGMDTPVERNPGDVHIWKARTVQEGKVDIEAAEAKAKAQKATPAPAPTVVPVKPKTAVELLGEYEAAKSDLEQWTALEQSCKSDLDMARTGYDHANQRVIDLRKELKMRIEF